MKFKDLPKLGEKLDGGIFAGLTTKSDDTHCAVVRLPGTGDLLNWNKAKAWAAKHGGALPSRPVAALLPTNAKDPQLEWHWTADEDDDFFAWVCYFNDGYQTNLHKSHEGSAVAVRLIPIAA